MTERNKAKERACSTWKEKLSDPRGRIPSFLILGKVFAKSTDLGREILSLSFTWKSLLSV